MELLYRRNQFEPVFPSIMWRDIKKLSGSSSFHNISQLKSHSSTLSDPQAISDLLATHFFSVSADTSYDGHLPLTIKRQAEDHPISFEPADSSLAYNLPFSTSELHSCIHKNRAVEPEHFFGSRTAGVSNFAGAGANLVKQAPEPKTGSST